MTVISRPPSREYRESWERIFHRPIHKVEASITEKIYLMQKDGTKIPFYVSRLHIVNKHKSTLPSYIEVDGKRYVQIQKIDSIDHGKQSRFYRIQE